VLEKIVGRADVTGCHRSIETTGVLQKKRDSEKNPLWQGFPSGLYEAASSRRPGVSGSWLLTVLRECAIELKGSNELCLKHE